MASPLAVEWVGGVDGYLQLLDQTLLPNEIKLLAIRDVETLWEAIRSLRVRGAPAIGVAAAMGMVLGAQKLVGVAPADFPNKLLQVSNYLRTSRPTAVNLFWALDRMDGVARQVLDADMRVARLLAEAQAIRREDADMCLAIGRHGANLLPEDAGVLTHCNAGALATADHGTALSVIFQAHARGKIRRVYVDETRPLLQGSRLTAWEMSQRNVPATLICDNMAAVVLRQNWVQAIVVGADRIAANGDTANKIGTYGLAVLAKEHNVPFYVAAPTSTFDLATPTGEQIPVEQRDPKEITHGFGKATAPGGIDVYNPAFDVTPHRYIAAIISEKGVHRAPYLESLAEAARNGP